VEKSIKDKARYN